MSDLEESDNSGAKKLAIAIGGPFLVVFFFALGLYTWDRGALPFMKPTSVPVTAETITRDNRGVMLTGTAHHTVRLLQKTEGLEDWYLVPVFTKGDTMGRDVHVLWRTQRPPDDMVSYEDVTVEGFARPPGQLVPYAARDTLEENGYTLTDDFVVVEEYMD